MATVAELFDAVVGGDTHTDTHSLEIASPAGTPLATIQIPNDATGFAAALAWIGEHSPGPRVLVALEGTRSFGVGLARALTAAGLPVVEVQRPRRSVRRFGETDAGDAHLAVLSTLQIAVDKLPVPRCDGEREVLRILLGARSELTTTKTRQINRLRALLLTGDDTDRVLLRGAMTGPRLATIARRRGSRDDSREQAVRRAEARRLALAIIDAERALAENKNELAASVALAAPELLQQVGIGPVCAAQAIVSWSHAGRCRNEAAFAALVGASPLEASSGRTARHRLNRGGDRDLNRALHDVTLTRLRVCPRTRTYVERRRADGKSDKEIRRCLKRYICREIYRILNASAAATTA